MLITNSVSNVGGMTNYKGINMANAKQEDQIRELGEFLNGVLTELYGVKMGFFLNVTPFNSDVGVCDYISNISRETAVELMKETIQNFENDQVIPAAIKGQKSEH